MMELWPFHLFLQKLEHREALRNMRNEKALYIEFIKQDSRFLLWLLLFECTNKAPRLDYPIENGIEVYRKSVWTHPPHRTELAELCAARRSS